MLYHALMKGDIEGKTVCDLGCGTGVLAIGAALLGADRVKGVDSDPKAVVGGKGRMRHCSMPRLSSLLPMCGMQHFRDVSVPVIP